MDDVLSIVSVNDFMMRVCSFRPPNWENVDAKLCAIAWNAATLA